MTLTTSFDTYPQTGGYLPRCFMLPVN